MSPTALLYRGAVMLRHPEAVRLWWRGVAYEQYRALRQPWLLRLGIGTVLDVGANVGQFARLAHAVFPETEVYSFEPLPECFERLKRALPGGTKFHPTNCAVGDRDGTLDFYPCRHSPSSSALRMTRLHEEAFPYTADGQTGSPIRVPVLTLDGLTRGRPMPGKLLLKMDVQGYEANVIAGGQETLTRAAVVLIEVSFEVLYEGQALFDDVYRLLREAGFEYRGNLGQMAHPADGHPVGADAVFVRTGELSGVRGG